MQKITVAQINDTLPQTQCTKCGYEGCLPYAEALASNEAEINQCPPGGQQGADLLAGLLDQPKLKLDESRGYSGPRQVAVIREDECIGCTKCIQACPVDAIMGAAKQMHTVLYDLCTGCDLCIAPCPVDCIDLVEESKIMEDTALAKKTADEQVFRDESKVRYDKCNVRLENKAKERQAKRAAIKAKNVTPIVKSNPSFAEKQTELLKLKKQWQDAEKALKKFKLKNPAMDLSQFEKKVLLLKDNYEKKQ
jgi:electron transport complex protein RnfB